MTDRIYNVLFLCTGNSARSIIAESALNGLGGGRFRAYSAGSHPQSKVHPMTLDILQKNRLPTARLRSKSWDEFALPGAPAMDFVFTVCSNAAGEVCPVWPGHPMTAHWGVDDPAAIIGPEEVQRQAFLKTLAQLQARISRLLSLSIEKLEAIKAQAK